MIPKQLLEDIIELSAADRVELIQYIAQSLLEEIPLEASDEEKMEEEEMEEEENTFLDGFEDFIEMRAAMLGVPNIAIEITPEEVTAISSSSDEVSFFEALDFAINSFLTDGKSIESLYALINECPEDFDLPRPATSDQINKTIVTFINEHKAKLRLVTPEFRYQAEQGESPTENWIFLLTDTNIWDGLNWAIVSRKKGGKVYNYGFN